MAYPRRRRFSSRSRYSRGYGSRYRARSSYGRSRGRRRSTSRRRSSGTRTIRLVVQTVAASPVALGMKGAVPVRARF